LIALDRGYQIVDPEKGSDNNYSRQAAGKMRLNGQYAAGVIAPEFKTGIV